MAPLLSKMYLKKHHPIQLKQFQQEPLKNDLDFSN